MIIENSDLSRLLKNGNKKFKNKITSKKVVARSASALSGEVQKFLRERLILYFHVQFFPYKNRIQFFTQNIKGEVQIEITENFGVY